jgi:GNAT superfamily N-acetyltransferase
MTEVTRRPATPADIPEATTLFLASVIDLAARYGLATPAFTAASIEPVYRHIQRTGIFEVAAMDGRIVAIAHAIVRDHLWFLSGLWVLPGLQRQGLGGPLLASVRAGAERRGATVGFTWSSVDFTAMAAYMKLGLLPGYPVLTFAGAPAALPPRSAAHEEAPLTLATAADIDAEVRGTRREVDHAFWLEGPAAGRAVLAKGRPAGYFYASGGVIGPAAWLDPAHATAVLAAALHAARAQAPAVRIAVPGINHTAVRLALSAGLKLSAFSHFLRTADLGKMEQYVPSGPSLF